MRKCLKHRNRSDSDLSQEEIKDVNQSFKEIELGLSKTFDNVEDFFKDLKSEEE